MLSFFPRGFLDEILNLIESVSEGFPSSSKTNDYIQIRVYSISVRSNEFWNACGLLYGVQTNIFIPTEDIMAHYVYFKI